MVGSALDRNSRRLGADRLRYFVAAKRRRDVPHLLNQYLSHTRFAQVQAMSAVGTALAVVVATYALTNLGEDQSWRGALLFGGIPMFLAIFVRAKMPESRLWSEYERRRKAGQLPPEKRAERSALIEIFRGASFKYFLLGALMCGSYIVSYQAITIFMPTLMIRDLRANPDVVHTDADLVSVLGERLADGGLCPRSDRAQARHRRLDRRLHAWLRCPLPVRPGDLSQLGARPIAIMV